MSSNYYSNSNAGAYGSAGSFQHIQPPSSGNLYYGAEAGSNNQNNSSGSGSNNNPYANPYANSTTQSQPQQQAPSSSSSQSQVPSFWTPGVASTIAAAATNNPNAMLDMATRAGHTFLDQGTARMIPGLERTMRELRVYFAVDNKYVQKKMLRVLCSFFFRHWTRSEVSAVHGGNHNAHNTHPNANNQGQVQGHRYAPPIHDENAVDLYIPSMSLVTYVLLSAVCYGTTGQFNAEVMPNVMTKCCVVQLLEVLAFRMGYYMLQVPASFMDLFAVTGYKFLGLSVNMLVGYSLSMALSDSSGESSGGIGIEGNDDEGGMSGSGGGGSSSSSSSWGYNGYYGTFLWTASAASYFMLKFMLNNIPDVTAKNGPKKEVVVLAFAGSQFAIMWFLGQTKALR